MGESGKLVGQLEMKSSVDLIYEIFSSKQYQIPKICPDKLREVELHEGDWGTVTLVPPSFLIICLVSPLLNSVYYLINYFYLFLKYILFTPNVFRTIACEICLHGRNQIIYAFDV